ncbi:MAG: Hsp20/alpha crystallin family protein [Leptospirillum sp.]|jgi:HSP20 family protein
MKPHDIDTLFLQLAGALSRGLTPEIVFRSSGEPRWQPMTDIYETEGEVVIKIELAGVPKEEISIGMDGNRLLVRGVRKDESKSYAPQKKKNYLQMEINYGEFERAFLLPEGLDPQSVRAEYSLGFLRVIVKRRPPRQIVTVHVTDGEELKNG